VSIDPPRLARLYGLAIGMGLLLEGGALLLLNILRPVLPMALDNTDVPHNSLHVAWGALILALLLTSASAWRGIVVVLVFGLFYTTLGVLGVLIDNPFGLRLGPGENAFHLIVGPVALGLSVWSALALSSVSMMRPTRQNQ
jgi:hypothetical protein